VRVSHLIWLVSYVLLSERWLKSRDVVDAHVVAEGKGGVALRAALARAVPANSKALCETMNWTLVPLLHLRVPSEIWKVEVQT
jgi:hypothetical protein